MTFIIHIIVYLLINFDQIPGANDLSEKVEKDYGLLGLLLFIFVFLGLSFLVVENRTLKKDIKSKDKETKERDEKELETLLGISNVMENLSGDIKDIKVQLQTAERTVLDKIDRLQDRIK